MTMLPGMEPPKPYTITTEPDAITVRITSRRLAFRLATILGYQGEWWRDMDRAIQTVFGPPA